MTAAGRAGLRGALMVCGTASDAGKSRVVTGLCRALARRGVRVAPFKAQNMALNSFVTPSGHEIGRAQGVQALAAGVDPDVDMNPILLKPSSDRTSQVIVLGEPVGHLDAADYHAAKPALRQTVFDALARLRSRFDVVLLEGAGSPAEINLLDADLVNLWLADAARIPAVVVGDIDRGGVFAALFGTVALLPDHLRSCVQAFVINKFRGDPALLTPGLADLEARTGVPTLGVLPWIDGLHLDAEDSLALRLPWGDDDTWEPHLPPQAHTNLAGDAGDMLDVAVIRFPRISNFTDVDALALERRVSIRYVTHSSALGDPDLVILPGTKATVTDLAWLRARGFEAALRALHPSTTVLGICGGYQMLGRRIDDRFESATGVVGGLGLLPAETHFEAGKVTRPRTGQATVPVAGPGTATTTPQRHPVTGYQIHHGRTTSDAPWITLADRWGTHPEGAANADGSVVGTSLHGLFESDGFRTAFLAGVADRRGKTHVATGVSFAAARAAQFDRLADLVETHLDMTAIEGLIAAAAPVTAAPSPPPPSPLSPLRSERDPFPLDRRHRDPRPPGGDRNAARGLRARPGRITGGARHRPGPRRRRRRRRPAPGRAAGVGAAVRRPRRGLRRTPRAAPGLRRGVGARPGTHCRLHRRHRGDRLRLCVPAPRRAGQHRQPAAVPGRRDARRQPSARLRPAATGPRRGDLPGRPGRPGVRPGPAHRRRRLLPGPPPGRQHHLRRRPLRRPGGAGRQRPGLLVLLAPA